MSRFDEKHFLNQRHKRSSQNDDGKERDTGKKLVPFDCQSWAIVVSMCVNYRRLQSEHQSCHGHKILLALLQSLGHAIGTQYQR